MSLFTYTHTHTHARARARARTHTHTHTPARARARTHTHTHIHTRTHTHTPTQRETCPRARKTVPQLSSDCLHAGSKHVPCIQYHSGNSDPGTFTPSRKRVPKHTITVQKQPSNKFLFSHCLSPRTNCHSSYSHCRSGVLFLSTRSMNYVRCSQYYSRINNPVTLFHSTRGQKPVPYLQYRNNSPWTLFPSTRGQKPVSYIQYTTPETAVKGLFHRAPSLLPCRLWPWAVQARRLSNAGRFPCGSRCCLQTPK